MTRPTQTQEIAATIEAAAVELQRLRAQVTTLEQERDAALDLFRDYSLKAGDAFTALKAENAALKDDLAHNAITIKIAKGKD